MAGARHHSARPVNGRGVCHDGRMADDLITTTEAARLLGIPVPRLLDLVIDGSIELHREGRGVRVRRADVEVLIDDADVDIDLTD